jgi:cytochrome c-type biogenesis protein CcmH
MLDNIKKEPVEDIYPFNSVERKNLFDKVIQELRCAVCQNQSLADSMAPLALDLKKIIYQKVQSQQYSEQQIIEFVAQRYGNFVLYNPPLEWSTALLWSGPCLILVVGLFILKRYINR